MTKQEFLAISLPYDLSVVFKEGSASTVGLDLLNEEVYILYKKHHEIDIHLQDVLPIIRPVNHLYKECVQSDYNDGKPFVPIEIIGKMYEKNGTFEGTFSWDCATGRDDYGKYYFLISDNLLEYSIYRGHPCGRGFCIKTDKLSFESVLELVKMHFWPAISFDVSGEKVLYVTEDFNPYINSLAD